MAAQIDIAAARAICELEMNCGDSSCQFTPREKNTGMRTNGGCCCFRGVGSVNRHKATQCIKLLPAALDEIERLRAERETMMTLIRDQSEYHEFAEKAEAENDKLKAELEILRARVRELEETINRWGMRL